MRKHSHMKMAETLSQSKRSLSLVSEMSPLGFCESHSFAVQNIHKIEEVKGTRVLKYFLISFFVSSEFSLLFSICILSSLMCVFTHLWLCVRLYSFYFPPSWFRNISAAWAKEDSKNETEERKIARQHFYNVSICLSSIPLFVVHPP